MNSFLNFFSGILRKKILFLLFLLGIGGVFVYFFSSSEQAPESKLASLQNVSQELASEQKPESVNSAGISCEVTPFSQTIRAGESVIYMVQVSSDDPDGRVKPVLGNLPRGVAGNLIEKNPVVSPGEFSLNLKTEKSARVAYFSLVILGSVDHKVACQYALDIQ